MFVKYNAGSQRWVFWIMYIPYMPCIPGHDRFYLDYFLLFDLPVQFLPSDISLQYIPVLIWKCPHKSFPYRSFVLKQWTNKPLFRTIYIRTFFIYSKDIKIFYDFRMVQKLFFFAEFRLDQIHKFPVYFFI